MRVVAKVDVNNHILDEFDNQNLTPLSLYQVVGIDHLCFRVINDAGEPILYPKYLFTVVDPTIPISWVHRVFGSDEYYIDPPEFSKPGFYEDYFDGKPESKAVFRQFIEQLHEQTR